MLQSILGEQMKYLKAKYKNYLILILGAILMAVGGVLFLTSLLGSDAIMVFNQGVAKTLNMEVGFAVMITNLLILVIMVILDRKTIGPGTIILIFLLGFGINFINDLNIFKTSDKVFINYLMVLGGIVIGGLGIAMYIYSDLGLAPFEGILIFIEKKTKWHFWIIKVINDAIFFTAGYLLGGTFGIGSIMTVFLFGPIIHLYRRLLEKTNLVKKSS